MYSLSRAEEQQKELEQRLRSFGGSSAVMRGAEADLTRLLSQGNLTVLADHQVRSDFQGTIGQCHVNSARLWVAHPGQGLVLWTGYALTGHNWVPHTWVMRQRSNELFEVTPASRDLYYGYPLTLAEAYQFARRQGLR